MGWFVEGQQCKNEILFSINSLKLKIAHIKVFYAVLFDFLSTRRNYSTRLKIRADKILSLQIKPFKNFSMKQGKMFCLQKILNFKD